MSDDRQARDARIRRLHRQGWSTRDIAREVGLTQPRVVQILSEDPVEVERVLADEERRLEERLTQLLAQRERINREIAAARATLRRLDEEREAVRIDRLLGL